MKPYFVALTFLFVASSAFAAEDQRFIKLEQDVRTLERLVHDLADQVNRLRDQLASGTPAASRPARPATTPVPAPTAWLTAANWNQVRPGMSELEVIGVLGPPTAMRVDEGSRVLLYAMEIGSSGFLGGNIKLTLTDRKVTEVNKPTLR